MGTWYEYAVIHGFVHIWWTDLDNEQHHITLDKNESAMLIQMSSDLDAKMQRALTNAALSAASGRAPTNKEE